jgi:hypothetical protein
MMKVICAFTDFIRVSDPDPDWIRIQIQEGKNYPSKVGIFFSCSEVLDVLF